MTSVRSHPPFLDWKGLQGLPISALCPRNAYTDYLHRSFKWFEEVQRGGYECDPDVGKTRVRMEHLCRHWLSDIFGFYNFNEMVVQVNPIEIFFLQFLPEDKRCFGCENIRIIGNIDDMSSEWAFNRFEYYMGVITGGRFSKPFIDRGVPVSRFAESEIGSKLRDAQYLKGRSCMKAELLEYLRPLGTVVDFGKSVDLETWMDRGKGADDEGQGRYSLLELR